MRNSKRGTTYTSIATYLAFSKPFDNLGGESDYIAAMEDTSVDQHPPGRADLYNYISANDICDSVDNTNVPNDITKNTDIIASIEPRLSFWPNNEDPWGKQTDPPSLVRAKSQPALHSSGKSLYTHSANTSVFPSGTTLNTTETEYTIDQSEQNSQFQLPDKIQSNYTHKKDK